jgi:hypothetical protein
MQTRAGYPNASFGIWRGSDIQAGGTGSGMGQADSGVGTLTQGFGSLSAGNWEPSVLYLLGFIVVEMVVFHILGRILK